MTLTATISKEFHLSASHQLVGLPDGHPCSRLHGHNYVVKITLTGSTDEVGFVVDYGRLKPFGDWLDSHFDHRHLNDQMEGNPTAETLAAFLVGVLRRTVPLPTTVTAVGVSVSETPKTWATVTDTA